jgi:hypothetical protein
MYRFSVNGRDVSVPPNPVDLSSGVFTHAGSFLGFDGHVEGLGRCVWRLEG